MAWQTVVGTLGGITITSIAAFITQRWQWKRQSEREAAAARREAYGEYIGAANHYFISLLNLSWALRNAPEQVEGRTEEAELLRPQVLSAKGRADILAVERRTKEAIDALQACLSDINSVLYEARSQRRDPKALPKRAQWEERYSAVRDYFLEAVQFELGLVGKISREVPPSRELKSTQKLT
jgi:hypothetical protein